MNVNKKQYFPPILTAQKHLRDMTLGGTPGTGESQDPQNSNPLPGEPRTMGNTTGDLFDAFSFDRPFDDPS